MLGGSLSGDVRDGYDAFSITFTQINGNTVPNSSLRGQLELTPDAMRDLGRRVVDMLVGHFANLREKPSTRMARRDELARQLNTEIPRQPAPIEEVLTEMEHAVFGNMGLTTHPRFFAFVPSPSNFVSAMADAAAAGFNAFMGNSLEAAGPVHVERMTIDWLRQMCGMPEGTMGLLVSGGSVANLTALAAARHDKLIGAEATSSASGVDEAEAAHWKNMADAVAYCSDQTHSSVHRAFRVLGFRSRQLARVQSDERFRIDVAALKRRVAADRQRGKRPFCVIANAGTINTGAVDPLDDLADLCAEQDLWLHADGAYGAAAAICDQGRELLTGLHRVDSLAIDPHKWLFQPYEIGCVLVRDGRILWEAFRITAEYLDILEQADEDVHFQDCGIQLTRSFRALKLWMSLKVFGLEGFQQAINRGIELAELAERILRQHNKFEIVTPAQLAVVTFRYKDGPSQQACDALNEAIARRTLTDGYATVTTTRLRDRSVLRMCTINPRTTEEDLRQTVRRLEQMGDDAAGV